MKNDGGSIRNLQADFDAAESESSFQRRVIALARQHGWMVHHTRPALRGSGRWSTPIQGDAGFPDLVLARSGVLWLVELKAAKGRVSEAQQEWWRATMPYYRLFRPQHWAEIEKLLRGADALEAIRKAGE